ncbi:MAG: ACT domain-containing protein [Clostridiales bacterium]|nr:ACT domain-containing protein [Clostridiales bacterium]
MRAVITVVGKDMVGILARVSAFCAENNVNIIEVTQSILQDMFCMVMLVDTKDCPLKFTEFSDSLSKLGEENGLVISAMHEEIFNTMHRI